MDDRDPTSALSEGLAWASRITTMALGFVLPAVAGYYLDQWLGSLPIMTLLGLALGFAVGLITLIQFARRMSEPRKRDD